MQDSYLRWRMVFGVLASALCCARPPLHASDTSSRQESAAAITASSVLQRSSHNAGARQAEAREVREREAATSLTASLHPQKANRLRARTVTLSALPAAASTHPPLPTHSASGKCCTYASTLSCCFQSPLPSRHLSSSLQPRNVSRSTGQFPQQSSPVSGPLRCDERNPPTV